MSWFQIFYCYIINASDDISDVVATLFWADTVFFIFQKKDPLI